MPVFTIGTIYHLIGLIFVIPYLHGESMKAQKNKDVELEQACEGLTILYIFVPILLGYIYVLSTIIMKELSYYF
jgi:hypothetical protein